MQIEWKEINDPNTFLYQVGMLVKDNWGKVSLIGNLQALYGYCNNKCILRKVCEHDAQYPGITKFVSYAIIPDIVNLLKEVNMED